MHQLDTHDSMRTTISLPESLLPNAKRCAEARNVTLSTVIEDALRVHLSGKQTAKVKFKLLTVRGKLVS